MAEIAQDTIDQFVSAAHHDLNAVKTMLDANPDLLATSAKWGETALQAATHTGQVEITEYLLSEGATLDICAAAMLGMQQQVMDMLKRDAALTSVSGAHGIPLLFYPAISGHKEIAALFLSSGADVNAGAGGLTPLHGAVLFAQKPMVEWLLANGADVNAKNHAGQTPLELAEANGQAEIVAVLKTKAGE
ncbi:MAG: ankyrin repeat domain-containing protein [Burkholderiales bacterium]|nr:ankyrin repeat domain-containing protein [Anaerolineae bacterium]